MNEVNEGLPDLFLWDEFTSFLVVVDFRLEISILSKLHDDAETLRTLFKKGFFVGNDVVISNMGN